jgi:hypothetical protein
MERIYYVSATVSALINARAALLMVEAETYFFTIRGKYVNKYQDTRHAIM